MLLLDELAREVQAYTIGALLARAMGGQGDIPIWETVRSAFDDDLIAPPDELRPEWNTPRQVALRALGLR